MLSNVIFLMPDGRTMVPRLEIGLTWFELPTDSKEGSTRLSYELIQN